MILESYSHLATFIALKFEEEADSRDTKLSLDFIQWKGNFKCTRDDPRHVGNLAQLFS